MISSSGRIFSGISGAREVNAMWSKTARVIHYGFVSAGTFAVANLSATAGQWMSFAIFAFFSTLYALAAFAIVSNNARLQGWFAIVPRERIRAVPRCLTRQPGNRLPVRPPAVVNGIMATAAADNPEERKKAA